MCRLTMVGAENEIEKRLYCGGQGKTRINGEQNCILVNAANNGTMKQEGEIGVGEGNVEGCEWVNQSAMSRHGVNS